MAKRSVYKGKKKKDSPPEARGKVFDSCDVRSKRFDVGIGHEAATFHQGTHPFLFQSTGFVTVKRFFDSGNKLTFNVGIYRAAFSKEAP